MPSDAIMRWENEGGAVLPWIEPDRDSNERAEEPARPDRPGSDVAARAQAADEGSGRA